MSAAEFPALPRLTTPLFGNADVCFCFTRTEWEQAHTSLGSTGACLDRRGAANTFRSLTGQHDIHLVGVFDGCASTLAHECAHIVFDICEYAGVRVAPGEANETFCHLLDALFAFGEKHQNTARELTFQDAEMFTLNEIAALGDTPTDAIAEAKITAISPSGFGVSIVFEHPLGFFTVSFCRSVGSHILYDAEAKERQLISAEKRLCILNARKTPEEQSTLHYEDIEEEKHEAALIRALLDLNREIPVIIS